MLIPRYTIRRLLLITTLCACYATVNSLAFRGHEWARAVSMAVGTLVLAALLAAVFFFVAWVMSFAFVRTPTIRLERKDRDRLDKKDPSS